MIGRIKIKHRDNLEIFGEVSGILDALLAMELSSNFSERFPPWVVLVFDTLIG